MIACVVGNLLRIDKANEVAKFPSFCIAFNVDQGWIQSMRVPTTEPLRKIFNCSRLQSQSSSMQIMSTYHARRQPSSTRMVHAWHAMLVVEEVEGNQGNILHNLRYWNPTHVEPQTSCPHGYERKSKHGVNSVEEDPHDQIQTRNSIRKGDKTRVYYITPKRDSRLCKQRA